MAALGGGGGNNFSLIGEIQFAGKVLIHQSPASRDIAGFHLPNGHDTEASAPEGRRTIIPSKELLGVWRFHTSTRAD